MIVHSYVKKPGGFYLGPTVVSPDRIAPGRVSKSYTPLLSRWVGEWLRIAALRSGFHDPFFTAKS